MRKGVNKVVTIHKLRILKVAIIELSLQGVMGENETWLVRLSMGAGCWELATKNPDHQSQQELYIIPAKVLLSFHSERNGIIFFKQFSKFLLSSSL